MPKAQPSNGAAAASSRAKALKFIPKTTDVRRGTEGARLKAKGKARSTLKDVHDLVTAANALPGAVQVERYAETRALEIGALRSAVKLAAAQGNSRAFQSLPRHLRRRAASHNPRRVPKKIRSKAAAEIDAGDRTVQIHRKKAKLMAKGLRGQSRTEQLRARQRADKKWLGTHIFHAKRFHMITRWGYRLPLTPTLKSFRSSYRAARRKAILHDASYFGTVQLEGCREEIVQLLSRLSAGGTFAGKRFETGTQAANVHIYEPENFPLHLIGPVQVIWEAGTASDPGHRRVWLRVHPSIYDEVLTAVRTVADGTKCALNIRNVSQKIEAFEIMGPLSGKILKRALRVARSEGSEKKCAFDSFLSVDPSECPTDAVLGVTVYDPRLSFPPRPLPDNDEMEDTTRCSMSETASSSTLWNCCEGNHGPRFKKSVLDQRRQKCGLPGTHLRPLANDDRVPIMIIRRSVQSQADDHESAAFQGYTLLFPTGWAMAFLPSFIYCNVRLGGMVERSTQYREAGIPSFPQHYGAVCEAGADWEAEAAREDESRWLRKPPGKRPEFSTLGTPWPFKPDWPAMSRTENEIEEASFNGDLAVKPWLVNPILGPYLHLISGLDDASDSLLEALNEFRASRGLNLLATPTARGLLQAGLCHVEIETLGRGSPSDMAMLYPLTFEEGNQLLAAKDHEPFEYTASQVKHIQHVSAKQVMGFVSTGNFSLTRGKGHGLATIKLEAYLRLSREAEGSHPARRILCLVKNRDGVVFRLASLVLAL